MRTRSIHGKLTQLSNLRVSQWRGFIEAWLLRGSSGSVPCVIPGSGRILLIPVREFYETYWFFAESRQGIREIEFFLRRLRPGDVVFDIGAFRGAYGAGAKAVLGDAVSVHLFEPIQNNIEGIRAVAVLNSFSGFEIVSKAVGSGSTIRGMLNSEAAMLRRGDTTQGLRAVEFPSTSLDVYIQDTGVAPTVVKVDVEGFELDVLEGARHLLSSHRPRLWIEVHPSYLKAQGHRWEELTGRLNAVGYRTLTFFEDYDLPTRDISFHLWCEF